MRTNTRDCHRIKILRVALRANGGFTFIELLIAIAILSLLSLTVILNITAFTKSGAKSSCLEEAQTIQTGVNSCLSEYNIMIVNQPTIVGPGQAAADAWLLTDGTNSGYVGAYLRREVIGAYSVDVNGMLTVLAYPGLDGDDIITVNSKLSGG